MGGPVRDLLLGQTPKDLDFTTDQLPASTQVLGRKAGASTVMLIGEEFGTVGFVVPLKSGESEQIEITTYRSESYPDGTRRPAVSHDVSLEGDLARRDFTLTAIAAHPLTGEIVDLFDGQSDIALGKVRAVGNPDERFLEDPLRLLRAARFVAQLGFLVDTATRDAMEQHASELKRISVERIYAELTKLLCGKWAGYGLDLLLSTGLFEVAMQELQPLAHDALRDATHTMGREKDLWEHTLKVIERAPERPIVRWGALLHDAAKPLTRTIDLNGEVHFFGHEREGANIAGRLLRRLKASNATIKSVMTIVELHYRPETYGPDWTDSAVRRLLLEVGDDIEDLLDLAAADVTSKNEYRQRAAARRITGLREHIARLQEREALDELQSPLDGLALMAMFDRKPGPWIAKIKDFLREMVIEGTLAVGDVESATTIAQELISTGAADQR
ncbi:CCA tRNA nucleotidyltransferase [soil metagenome]